MHRHLHAIIAIITLATPTVAGAVVNNGNEPDDAVTFSFDEILRSMNDATQAADTLRHDNVTPVENTLDYMAELFTSGPGSEPILGGDQTAMLHTSLPDGDIPINVSEFHMPVSGRVTSPFGQRPRFNRFHRGIDMQCNGDTVRAAFPGTVNLTRFDPKGYGYYILITHPNGLQTLYAHLGSILVVPSAKINAGDPIAIGGSTGNSTRPHLHFETRYRAVPLNPSEIVNLKTGKPISPTFIFNKKRHTPQ